MKKSNSLLSLCGSALLLVGCNQYSDSVYLTSSRKDAILNSPVQAEPSPLPTLSPKPSPVPSPTVSPKPSPTVSPRPSPTPSPTVSPRPSPTASPKPTPVAADCPTGATCFYVSSSAGNDTASGSITSPWKTISRVNYKSFAPGTHILFKRGDIWREMLQPTSGTSSGHITYGAYGTGAKPQLMGSIERNSTSDWVYEGGYWVSKGISKDVGNIIFNNDQSVGRKYWNLSELKSQGDFWYDATNRQVRMISSANPASLYSDIELALDGINIDMYQRNYVIIKDLWLRNGDYGIFIQNGSNIVIRNNDFSFLGGGKLGSGVRAGNGVEVWESGTNILIERNRLWEIYDAALSHQGANSTTQRNIVYRFNTVWRSEYCFEFFTYNTAAIVDGIEFSNNTCVDSGMGWGHAQRPDPSGRHVLFWDYRPTGRTVIKNNIFSRSAEVSLYIGTLNGNLGISNNLWQQAATSPIARGGTTTYTTQNFQTFKNNTGYALTDFIADPFFVNPAARDYAPALNSRACTASDTGSFIGAVPCK